MNRHPKRCTVGDPLILAPYLSWGANSICQAGEELPGVSLSGLASVIRPQLSHSVTPASAQCEYFE